MCKPIVFGLRADLSLPYFEIFSFGWDSCSVKFASVGRAGRQVFMYIQEPKILGVFVGDVQA